jgi:hypothetical protein
MPLQCRIKPVSGALGLCRCELTAGAARILGSYLTAPNYRAARKG